MITSRHTSRILFRTKRIATTKSFMGELAAKREMYKMKATYTGTGFTWSTDKQVGEQAYRKRGKIREPSRVSLKLGKMANTVRASSMSACSEWVRADFQILWIWWTNIERWDETTYRVCGKRGPWGLERGSSRTGMEGSLLTVWALNTVHIGRVSQTLNRGPSGTDRQSA